MVDDSKFPQEIVNELDIKAKETCEFEITSQTGE